MTRTNAQDAATFANQTLTHLPPLPVETPPDAYAHGGMLNAYNSVTDTIHSTIQATLSNYSGYAIVAVGHDIGGGIAAIAAYDFLRTLVYG